MGVCVVPSIQLCPVDCLVESIETNLVIRRQEASLGVFQPGLEGDLFPPPVVENTEETQAGKEHGDD